MHDLSDAIAFAQAHEVPWPRDPAADPARWGVHHDDPPPYNRLRGPVHPRGGVSGVIRVRGEEVASWGEPDRADLTFSVAKTYRPSVPVLVNSVAYIDVPYRFAGEEPERFAEYLIQTIARGGIPSNAAWAGSGRFPDHRPGR